MKTFTATPEEFQTGEAAGKARDFFRSPTPKKPRKKLPPYKSQERQVGTITPAQFLRGDTAWPYKRRYGHRTAHDPEIKPLPESVVDVLLEAPDDVPDEYYIDLLKQDKLRTYQHTGKDVLRKVKLDGYTLILWDTHRGGMNSDLGYELLDRRGRTLFHGEDYHPGAGTAIDSDAALRGILGFLTLKPGDTDDEYFANYTPEQMAFAEGDAEELGMYALDDEPLAWDEDFEVGNWMPGDPDNE